MLLKDIDSCAASPIELRDIEPFGLRQMKKLANVELNLQLFN